jgi:hypothetical protein
MNSRQLELTFSELSRSGYTTIMDLAKLEKRHSSSLHQDRTTIFSKKIRGRRNSTLSFQEEFKIADITNVTKYKGLDSIQSEHNWNTLFYFKNNL